MTNKKEFVKTVRDLNVYRNALLFRRDIYKIVEKFPGYEQYNMSDILRKSACSIVSNIAEGNTNYYFKKEFNHYNIGLSKVGECRSALDIVKMQGYIDEVTYKSLDVQAEEILKILVTLMKGINHHISQENDESESVDPPEINHVSIADIHHKALTFNDFISGIARQYPSEEANNMKDQIVRASESILNNLKQPQNRSSSQAFSNVNLALGSISECLAFLDMGVMEGFISRSQYEAMNDIGKAMLDSIIDMMNPAEKGSKQNREEVS